MGSRWRNQWSQTFEQFVTLHQNVRCAVAPAGLQLVCEAAVRRRFESICCEWRAGHVTAKSLQTATVECRHGNVGV
jgi:hypothetical protein